MKHICFPASRQVLSEGKQEAFISTACLHPGVLRACSLFTHLPSKYWNRASWEEAASLLSATACSYHSRTASVNQAVLPQA